MKERGTKAMTMRMAATHAADKELHDAIFGASEACRLAAQKYGADKVTNATIGTMMDDEGKFATLPTVERIYRELSIGDYMRYAPIAGLPEYLEAVIDLTFADQRPEGYFASVATPGGTGAIRHAVANYAEHGDFVLTSDWFWGTYNVICNEYGTKLTNFKLFDDKLNFNLADFNQKVEELLSHQDSLLAILNTPAQNPTGFSLTEDDWDGVLAVAKAQASKGKKVILLVDIAYIDFAGEKNETRAFMKKFSNLPENILVLTAFSMSKGYTAYGQRTGALVAVSSSKEVIEEFKNVTKYSGRATWSNINRGAMTLLVRLQQDKAAYAQFEKERDEFYELIKGRAAIFTKEAEACGLPALPYKGGFFLAVPAADPKAVCEKLHEDLIFAVPLKLGVRVAACSVATAKMPGIAEKVLKALKAVE